MKSRYYAACLTSDQPPGAGEGICGRKSGSLSEMRDLIGKSLGRQTKFYSSLIYELDKESDEQFIDDQHQAISGYIYKVVER